MTATSPDPEQEPPASEAPGDERGNDSLQGFMTNEEWDDLLVHVNKLVQQMEELPDPGVRKQVFDLLQGIDAIHRESLTRLVRLFKEGVLEQVVTDPPIHTLMELYDLLPGERRGDPDEPAQDEASAGRQSIPIRVMPEEPPTLAPDDSGPPPHWVPVLDHRDDLEAGAVMPVTADERRLLLCRVDDEIFALDRHCPRDGSSLADATLQRYLLACPRHAGCYYDVRNGARLGGRETLECFALREDDNGRVLVGFGVPFRPNLPAF